MRFKDLLIFPFLFTAVTLTYGQSWVAVEASGEPEPRQYNGFMSCKGRFFLLGGYGIQPVNMYDPATGAWTSAAAPPVEMHHFQAVRYGEEIYILGAFTGRGEDEKPLEHIYVYDTSNDTWRKGDPIPPERLRGACGVIAYRGMIYMIGGSKNRRLGPHTAWVDRYDIRTGKWKKMSDAPHDRFQFHAGVINGKAYAAGGRGTYWFNELESVRTVPYVDVFELESGRWKTLPYDQNIPTPRSGCATVAILDHLLVMGGESEDRNGAHRVVEAFDPENGMWESWGSLIEGRKNTQAFMCVGTVFIASGNSLEMLEMK